MSVSMPKRLFFAQKSAYAWFQKTYISGSEYDISQEKVLLLRNMELTGKYDMKHQTMIVSETW